MKVLGNDKVLTPGNSADALRHVVTSESTIISTVATRLAIYLVPFPALKGLERPGYGQPATTWPEVDR
jgi:hypothetical protein